MEQMRAKVDTLCRSNYQGIGSFLRQRRGERGQWVTSGRLCVVHARVQECVCERETERQEDRDRDCVQVSVGL